FVTRLFQIGADAKSIAVATAAQDALFRFKVDFVRKRALPLTKKGAHVPPSPDDDRIVSALLADQPKDDLELAIARAGCALLDAEKGGSRPAADLARDGDALKRWCAARLH